MSIFEYKSLDATEILSSNGEINIEKLNDLGRQGWELILVVNASYLFKRKIVD